jgi:hypothetical protein
LTFRNGGLKRSPIDLDLMQLEVLVLRRVIVTVMRLAQERQIVLAGVGWIVVQMGNLAVLLRQIPMQPEADSTPSRAL